MDDAIRSALESLVWDCKFHGVLPRAVEKAERALAQQPAQGEAVAFDLTLDEDEARTLRDGIGDGCVQAVRLQVGEGHSGYGLYVSSSEYPEDGSALVCEMIERTAPPAPSVPDAKDETEFDGTYGVQTAYRKGWNACRAAMLASGGKASVQWETCESQCTCKVCGTVWTAPEPPR